MTEAAVLEPIQKLTRDLKVAAKTLSRLEARYLVDSYYQLQETRKASSNQVLATTKADEPCEVLMWFRDNAESLEAQIKRALGSYASNHRVGRWSQEQIGIGPVIAAGLLAHIDIEKAPTVGHIWRFAGLDPTMVWEKGQKRPFNANLKTLCWKIGQSFLKFSNHEDCFYGKLFRERWDYEKGRNERGELADQAKAKLEKFKIGKSTEAYGHYSAGHLPPAHVLQRACRWTTKRTQSRRRIGRANKFWPWGARAQLQTSEPCGQRAPKSESEPPIARALQFQSEPCWLREPSAWSEPSDAREPNKNSEPMHTIAARAKSEPASRRVPGSKSEPEYVREPPTGSEPSSLRVTSCRSEPGERRGPRGLSEPCLVRAPLEKSAGGLSGPPFLIRRRNEQSDLL